MLAVLRLLRFSVYSMSLYVRSFQDVLVAHLGQGGDLGHQLVAVLDNLIDAGSTIRSDKAPLSLLTSGALVQKLMMSMVP